VITLLTALLLIGGALASCSLPADDQVTTFSPDDLPIDLTSPSTTTTSTSTTTTVASTGGETTDSPPPTTAPPTTLPIVDREPIRVFYRVSLTSDSMTRVTVNLATPVQLMAVIRELEVPNDEIRATGIRTSVRVNLIETVDVERGVATVALSKDELDKMSLQEQQRAVAQIVLTLTSFVTPDAGAIALVSFSVDGEPISVFLPDGTNTEAGTPVTFADYVVLIEGQPTTTTTTTSTTTTTAPPGGTTLPVEPTLPPPIATTATSAP
jgi:hypothetical protein